jgi:hypothetical protein
MPNTSKILSGRFIIAGLTIGFLCSSVGVASEKCALPVKNKKIDVIDSICDQDGTSLFLQYNPKSRLIWIDSNKTSYRINIISLEKNANPELVGSKDEIKFFTRNSINQGGKRFIGLTFAERSMRGNGMGQCGSGAEVYFVAIELSDTRLIPINRFKIESCIDGIDLASHSSESGNSMVVTQNNSIMFRWLNYPNFENPATGIYSFSSNQLKLRENLSPYVWQEFE